MRVGNRRLVGSVIAVVFSLGAVLILESAPENPDAPACTGVRSPQPGTPAAMVEQVNIDIETGAWQDALEHASEAVAATQRAGDPLLEAEALQTLGNTFYLLDRYSDALSAFNQALTLAQVHGDRRLEALLLKDLGITEKFLGLYGQALLHLQLAAEVSPQPAESPVTVSILGNLGSLYRQLGAHNLALNTLEEGLDQARLTGDTPGQIDCLQRIGNLYLGLDRAERALDFINPALDLQATLEPGGHALSRGWLLELAMNAYWAVGQRDAAKAKAQEALTMWRAVGNRAEEGQVLAFEGWLTIDDSLDRAEELFENALTLGTVHPEDAVAGLAEVALRRGERDSAIELLTSAVDQLEALRGAMISAHKKVEFTDQNLAVYHRLIEALVARGRSSDTTKDLDEAFHVLEKARSRVLSEVLAKNRLETAQLSPPQTATRGATIQQRLRTTVDQLAREDIDDDEHEKLLLELQKVELEADAVTAGLQYDLPRGTPLPSPEPLTVGDTQALLNRRTALLSYMVTGDRVFVFVITRIGLAVEELPTTANELTSRVCNAQDLLRKPSAQGWATVGARLAYELIDPVRIHLGTEIEELIIVPDGPLHSLPFEALPGLTQAGPLGDGPRFLLEDYEISYAPSATVLAELHRLGNRRQSNDPVDALVFAAPDVEFETDAGRSKTSQADRFWRLYEDDGFVLSPLPNGTTEAAIIAEMAGAGSSINVGADATETLFKSRDLGRFGIIHFATHGLVTPASPARSALILLAGGPGEDGFLQAREIGQLSVEASLVVLSACRTAVGRRSPSEGVQSLARAFLTAGASSVLCSLRNVGDAETARLMAGFYRSLGAGRSTASALRAAKLQVISMNREGPPAAWASFILIGDGGAHVPLKSRHTMPFDRLWFLILVVAALTGTVATAVWMRTR